MLKYFKIVCEKINLLLLLLWTNFVGKTFNVSWLKGQRFKDWLEVDSDRHRVKCKTCKKSIDISNIRVQLLWSESLKNTVERQPQSTPSTSKTGAANNKTLDSCLVPLSVIQAEIRWMVKVVMSHYFRSCLFDLV